MIIFFLGISFILAGGFGALLINEKEKARCLAIFSGIGTFFILVPAIKVLVSGITITSTIKFTYPIGNVSLIIDPLSAFFLSLISIMSFIGIIYSIGYIKPYLHKRMAISSHYFFLSILVISMLLVCIVQNALAFLVVWEIMAISSFFLVIFESEKKEVIHAGINYIINMHIGLFILMVGFLILSINAGNVDFSSFKVLLNTNTSFTNTMFIIFFLGFGVKAGFFPVHTWLPRAHPAAPSHISGMMSGIMIKTGIYGILRILTLINKPSLTLSYFVLMISIISAVYGIIYAIRQNDIKKMLAYCSIENIGIIGIGIGIGMLGLSYNNNIVAIMGFSGSILHILNHSIFKGLLFYGAGFIYQKTHTKNMEHLGGLAKKMPAVSLLFLIGSIAISGLPPFNGFISEFIIYNGMFQSFLVRNPFILVTVIISVASLALVGAMALLCFTKAFSAIFLGNAKNTYTESINDISPAMLVSMVVLAIFTLLIGLFPQYVFKLLINPVSVLVPSYHFSVESLNFVSTLSTLSWCIMAFIIIAGLIYLIRYLLLKQRSVYQYKTWDCGYQAGNNRMQYTSSSYADPFLSLTKPLVHNEVELTRIEGFFPQEASLKTHNHDVVEIYLLKPAFKGIKSLLHLFSWVQSGDTQLYIFYGLTSLVATLLWIMLAN
ncbi:MAG: hypothetical protein DKM50_13450 [Candidatus Margulisiibacteriota bacterium]|nr:MAG: hypothetical protein DKM50_13450 [Candidatus Margulisiibacteriota bacterium]HCY35903.1 hypothetical protein [Candidatus Margulisiibacteriota bacterium]